MALVIPHPCNGPCCLHPHVDDDECSDQAQTFYIRASPHLRHGNIVPYWVNKPFALWTSGNATMRYIFWGWSRMRRSEEFRGDAELFKLFFVANVSPSHAEIVVNRSRGKAYLRDLNSSLGTWLNGRKLNPHQSYELSCGDVFSLGECVTVTENHLEDKLNVFIFNVLHTPRGAVVSPSQADLEARNWHVDQHHLPELVEQVARYLDIQNLKNLRLVNKFWGREATRALGKRRPVILRRITYLGVNPTYVLNFFEEFVERQRQFNTGFVDTFGSRDRLFNPALRYTITISSGVVAKFPALHEETLRLYTSFMRLAGIWMTNLTLQVYYVDVLVGQQGFIRAILEQHAETLEELDLDFRKGWDRRQVTDLVIPNSFVLPRVKKAKVSLPTELHFDNLPASYLAAVSQFGRDLATIMPNLESLSLNPSTSRLMEDALLHGQLRALSVLNLTYINCPEGGLLMEPPIPLTKLTLHFELKENGWWWYGRLGHLNRLLTRTFRTLQELELGMSGKSDNFPNDPIKFPRMLKLRKLTLCLAHTDYGQDDEDPSLMDLTFKSLLDNDGEAGPLRISTSFPSLEELAIVQVINNKTQGRVRFGLPKADWTRIMEAFFPKADELERRLIGTLTRLVLPGVNNFRLGDYDLTLEDLKAQFPNLKMILDQNDVQLCTF